MKKATQILWRETEAQSAGERERRERWTEETDPNSPSICAIDNILAPYNGSSFSLLHAQSSIFGDLVRVVLDLLLVASLETESVGITAKRVIDFGLGVDMRNRAGVVSGGEEAHDGMWELSWRTTGGRGKGGNNQMD